MWIIGRLSGCLFDGMGAINAVAITSRLKLEGLTDPEIASVFDRVIVYCSERVKPKGTPIDGK